MFFYYFMTNLIMLHITLPFSWDNGFEYLWGCILTSFIMKIIETIIFKLSYRFTGNIGAIIDATSEEMRKIHWRIRFILTLLLLLITIIPISKMFITAIVHTSYQRLTKFLNSSITNFSNNLINTNFKTK